MNREYVKLEKNAKDCMASSAVCVLAIILIPATIICCLVLESGILKTVILATAWILAILYVLFVPRARYERYRYYIDEESIRVRKGFIWISESIVPMERLHKIEVSQGPFDRMFGLSTVRVTTAGGDVNIKFLKDNIAEEIAEMLKSKINDIVIAEREKR